MTTVYVSATQSDLAEYRQVIRTASQRLGFVDIAMESYVAGVQLPLEKCLDDVARSDYYIGLFAWRYGFIPPGEDRSITELEYRKATQLGKPCLIFLLADDAAWPGNLVDRGASGERMAALRRELMDTHLCGFFHGLDDLAAVATVTLAHQQRTDPRPDDVSISSALPRPRRDPDAWTSYYSRLRAGYLGIEVASLSPIPYAKVRRATLTSLYIEPTVRRHDDLGATVALFDLLTDPQQQCTVLLGDPGAGKSAAVRYAVLCLAKIHDDPRLTPLSGHVPLHIELRTYMRLVADGKCEDFIGYLDHRCRVDGLGIATIDFRSHFDGGGRAFVVFDGLDEILDRRRREDVSSQIVAFAAMFPAARVVVTSRIVGYNYRTLSGAGFDHVTLDEFGDEQISEFLRRWHGLVEPDRSGEAEARRLEATAAIRDWPAIRQLAGNPLLLSILSTISTSHELSKGRWRAFEDAADVLLEHWDADRHIGPSPDDGNFLDLEDRKAMLRRLAVRMQLQRSDLRPSSIDHEQLNQIFEDYIVERYSHPRGAAHALANTTIEQFCQRGSILRTDDESGYDFAHWTFREFFFAQFVLLRVSAGDPEWSRDRLRSLIADHWSDWSWREIVLLLVGSLESTASAEFIATLAIEIDRPWPATSFTELPGNIALAIQCLAHVPDPTAIADVADAVLRQLILLLEHGIVAETGSDADLIEAEVLPAARLLGANWPGRESYLTWYRRRGVAVSWNGGSALATRLAVLLATAQDRVEDFLNTSLRTVEDRRARLALVAGLTEVVNLPTTPAGQLRRVRARDLLEERVRTDSQGLVRLAALRALVTHFPIDAAMSDLLADRALNDPHPETRLMAVQNLGTHGAVAAETRAVLLDRAQHDSVGSVRGGAIEMLVNIEDDDVQQVLIERVRSDRSAGVVNAAARALIARGRTNDVLRSVLNKRVYDDDNDGIRQVAARLLREWFADTDTHELLLDLLTSDGDPGVRGIALRGVVTSSAMDAETRARLIDRAEADDDAALRQTAQRIVVARRLDGPSVRELLVRQARGDPDADTRRSAIAALAANFADDEAIELLDSLAESDGSARVRLASVAAMESLADRGAEPALRRALLRQLADVDSAVRRNAVSTLINIGLDAPTCDGLLTRLQVDADPQIVRDTAGALLSRSAYRSMALASLYRRLREDAYAGVRQAVIETLTAQAPVDPDLGPLLRDVVRDDSDPDVLRSAAEALVRHLAADETLMNVLTTRSMSDYWQIRLPTIDILGRQFQANAAVRSLLVDRSRADPEIQVRRAAVQTLADVHMPHPDVRALFVELLGEDDWALRRQAVAALATDYRDDAELRGRFAELLTTDPDPSFRQSIVQALTCWSGTQPDDFPDAVPQ